MEIIRASSILWYALVFLSKEYGLLGLFIVLFNAIITCSCVECTLSKFLLTHDCSVRIILSPSLLKGTGTISGDLHSVYLNLFSISGFNASNFCP
jgi:hypothetical protein